MWSHFVSLQFPAWQEDIKGIVIKDHPAIASKHPMAIVNVEKYHITCCVMKFPADKQTAVLEAVKMCYSRLDLTVLARLKTLCYVKLDHHVVGVEVGPRRGRGRNLLEQFNADLIKCLEQAGATVDKGIFFPHITVMRCASCPEDYEAIDTATSVNIQGYKTLIMTIVDSLWVIVAGLPICRHPYVHGPARVEFRRMKKGPGDRVLWSSHNSVLFKRPDVPDSDETWDLSTLNTELL